MSAVRIAVARLQVKAAKTASRGKLGQFCQFKNEQLAWNQWVTGERIPLPPPHIFLILKHLFSPF